MVYFFVFSLYHIYIYNDKKDISEMLMKYRCLLYTHQCIAKLQAVSSSGIQTNISHFPYHHSV